MRSLLASLLVLSLGIVAALPFRKSSDAESETPPLDRSQLASLVSPLEEIDTEAPDLSTLNLSEISYSKDDSGMRPDLSGGQSAFPSLPKSRRPFAQALVQPTPLLPESRPTARPDSLDIANRNRDHNQDWNLDLPLKYVQPQTGLQVEEIAEQPRQTPAEATRGSLSWSPATTQDSGVASGMRIHQAGSRNVNEPATSLNREAPATSSPQYEATPAITPKPRARKRFFVYEPAG